VRFFELSVDIFIRTFIFIVPTAFVAQWCDVALTDKSIIFVMFCVIWHDMAFGTKPDSPKQDNPTALKTRKAAVAMTPAQVATEARKLGHWPKPDR
jgi:hypothetical protein